MQIINHFLLFWVPELFNELSYKHRDEAELRDTCDTKFASV